MCACKTVPAGILIDLGVAIAKEGRRFMGINTPSDIEANLQIGPTSDGMVRLFIETQTAEIPLDFDPEEAEEIAAEIQAAAARARAAAKS